jgi:hypothetical protein
MRNELIVSGTEVGASYARIADGLLKSCYQVCHCCNELPGAQE